MCTGYWKGKVLPNEKVTCASLERVVRNQDARRNDARPSQLPYRWIRSTFAVAKPFKTTPLEVSRKKQPGICTICSGPATTQALFDVGEAVLVRKYCDKCLPKADYEE